VSCLLECRIPTFWGVRCRAACGIDLKHILIRKRGIRNPNPIFVINKRTCSTRPFFAINATAPRQSWQLSSAFFYFIFRKNLDTTLSRLLSFLLRNPPPVSLGRSRSSLDIFLHHNNYQSSISFSRGRE